MIDPNNKEDVKRVIEEDNREELVMLAISAAHNCADGKWVEHICLTLSAHEDETVRGNAILSFGHMARIFQEVTNETEIREIVVSGLNSESKHVHGQAVAASWDLSDFLGWNLKRELRKARRRLKIRW